MIMTHWWSMLKDPTKVQRLSGCHCCMLNGCKARIDASAFPSISKVSMIPDVPGVYRSPEFNEFV